MNETTLFPKDKIIGIFRGFSQGGLEFHADIVLPYKNEFQSIPMHGQFVLVQLATEQEAILGRITALSSEGRLSSGMGEDYSIRALRGDREIPDDLRDDYLKYCVNIRVLGVLRKDGKEIHFVASHRRLPHVGSRVAWPSDDILKEIVCHNIKGAELGYFTLGEYIFGGSDKRLTHDPGMQILNPTIITRFPVDKLVSRRTFIFARAGFGKSNLNKLLFSNLYKDDAFVEKRGRKVPVGTIIFDPEGEYFWPDDKGRPGLCDVPALQDKVVVFTDKAGPSGFYQSFIAGNIRLDIRRLNPGDVVAIALTAEQQNQQNVRKLRALNSAAWEELVNIIDSDGLAADLEKVKEILHLQDDANAEATAAKSNMIYIVRLLHRRDSQLLDMLLDALRDGRICIIDVSRLRGKAAFVLSGIILKYIFDFNQNEFTKAQPKSIPTIAVLEEAQSVLGSKDQTGENPYIAWVKEGRKYDLGAVLITQQPGSISPDILSQGDNWFIFHLLSAIDVGNVNKANAHFSEDILSSLLNEPIPGHCAFWSSALGKSYPIPLRILSFENITKVIDSQYNMPAVRTYAIVLKDKYQQQLDAALEKIKPNGILKPATSIEETSEIQSPLTDYIDDESGKIIGEERIDAFETYKKQAIEQLNVDTVFREEVEEKGITWKGVGLKLKELLPEHMTNRESVAFEIVRQALNTVFGEGGWDTEKRPRKSGSGETTWVIKKKI